jgi:dolichol-phosphate mannosyltransferase
MARIAVLLPCLNEEAALPGLLEQLAKLPGVEALVVDDGSTDGTAAIAKEWPQRGDGLAVHLVRHAQNMGLGAALLTGIKHFTCTLPDCTHLCVMDADGTHPPELLSLMLSRMPPADVVIASRYAPGGEEHGLTLRRKIYSRGASLLLAMAARVKGARDYSCGYRLYSREILERGLTKFGDALVTERSFVCMAELLCKLAACGAVVDEVPLALHYELKQGASKMNVPVTIRRYVALVARLVSTNGFRRG